MDKRPVILCTLFDHNFLDRGLVLYESLDAVEPDFTLYVLAMDDNCLNILQAEGRDRLVIIPFEQFMNDRLEAARKDRSLKEFIWTCSGFLIKYVLENYDVHDCTYVDADMFFYSSPRVLLDDFYAASCDAGIIPHRYSRHYENAVFEKYCGKYCVEFNTFKNNENGRKILDWWVDSCARCCTSQFGADSFGDQKYLDEFEERFDGVYIYDDPGAGVAPWNVDAYRLGDGMDVIRDSVSSPIIFYHFHDFTVIDEKHYRGNIYTRAPFQDRKLIDWLYPAYYRVIMDQRHMLHAKYGLYSGSEGADNIRKSKLTVLRELGEGCPTFLFFIITLIKILLFTKRDTIEIEG